MGDSDLNTQAFYIKGSHQGNILFATFYIIVFIVAVPGNVLALCAFCRQQPTSPTKVFLRHLAVADVSYILILPMRVVYHLSDSHWPFGKIPCRLAGFLFYLNTYSSLYFMTFISLDRFLAIMVPVRSKALRKPVYAKVMVGLLWVTVIVSMSPLLLSTKPVTVNITNSTVTCSQLYLEKTSRRALVSTAVAFFIPLVTIVVSYVMILWKLRGLNQQGERPVKDRAIRMITLIIMNFVLAFVPYHVVRIIYIEEHSEGRMTAGGSDVLSTANRITSAMTCISGVLDPVLYFFMANAYKNIVCQVFFRKRDDEQPTSNAQ